jgi:F-type H+-transporting ATPase subunit delta
MPRKVYARRYAQAAFEIALEKKELEQWQSDLQKVVDAVSDETFLAALESPKIRLDDKSRLLSKRLGKINPLVSNMVKLLIERGGIGMIGKIADEFRRLLDSYRGIQTADITTAVPLDNTDKKKLAENLGRLLDMKIEIRSQVDPEIIGGIIARVSGKLLDGSTRTKLQALKRELAGRK